LEARDAMTISCIPYFFSTRSNCLFGDYRTLTSLLGWNFILTLNKITPNSMWH
jgi:hypothetical protein